MPKKIAVIASYLHPTMQAHLLDWYQSLAIDGYEFQLFLGSKNDKIPYAKNYKINTKLEKAKYFFKNILIQKNIPQYLKKIQPLTDYKPDLIHLLTSNIYPNIELLLKEKEIPVIISFRGYDINVFPFESDNNLKLTQRIFQRATVLHFISNRLKKTALEIGADEKKCVTIYRSIDIDRPFISKNQPSNKIQIISVGRCVWEKGYTYALDTMAILKTKEVDFHYTIVGDGPEMSTLKQKVVKLNLVNKVSFKGFRERNEIPEFLSNADIYFQPSITEALSNALIEASFYKLPVVSSDIGGIPEVVENNVTGFLSEIKNPNIYAENIIKLINNENLRLVMGEHAHRRIKKMFSRENEMKNWEQLYREILK